MVIFSPAVLVEVRPFIRHDNMHHSIMDLDVRAYKAGDSAHLLSIDLKGSEIPFTVTDWQLIQRDFPHWTVLFAIVGGKPCGFALFSLDTEKGVARVHKLAALPYARSIGAMSMLLSTVQSKGIVAGMQYVEVVVPSHECRGKDDPYDRSHTLNNLGFKCVNITEGVFNAYGELAEAYCFRKPIDYGE